MKPISNSISTEKKTYGREKKEEKRKPVLFETDRSKINENRGPTRGQTDISSNTSAAGQASENWGCMFHLLPHECSHLSVTSALQTIPLATAIVPGSGSVGCSREARRAVYICTYRWAASSEHSAVQYNNTVQCEFFFFIILRKCGCLPLDI